MKPEPLEIGAVPPGLPPWRPPAGAPTEAGAVAASVSFTPGAPQRFTLDGGPALEQRLAEICAAVGRGVQAAISPNQLEGLLLGGGYGRGEGGVLATPTGEEPYNDLEFYVFVAGNALLGERRFGPALRALGHRLSAEFGIEIEFKLLSRAKLRAAAPAMFYYDLVVGHRWVIGGEALLEGCGHHQAGERIPLSEATRLLFNRGSGLLFSQARLAGGAWTDADADFVGRNLAKMQLALGDVFLAARGRYHWSCRERHRRLLAEQAAHPSGWLTAVVPHHTAGVAFKLRPRRSRAAANAAAQSHAELNALARDLWLWLESGRLGAAFPTARDYALSPVDKCPETTGLRNRLVRLKAFGPRALWAPNAARYPRQDLLQALCLLLWEPATLADPTLLRRVQTDLGTTATTLAGLVAAYEPRWHRFN